MPNALAHSLFASFVAIISTSILPLPFETKIISGLLIIGFSFLPDLDHKRAVARQAYRKAAGIVVFALVMVVLSLFAHIDILITLIAALFIALVSVPLSEALIPGHRGIMHSVEFAIGIGLIVYVLLTYLQIQYPHILALSAFVGYSSHILLDRIA